MRKLTPEERRELVNAPISIRRYNYHGEIHDKDRMTDIPLEVKCRPANLTDWSVREILHEIIDIRYKQNYVWVDDPDHPKGGYRADTSEFTAVQLLAELEQRKLSAEEQDVVQKMRGQAWWRPRLDKRKKA